MRSLLAALLVVPLLAGCGSREDDYCSAVKSDQKHLTEVVGSGAPDALLQALGTFQDLQRKAPDDISDEWQQVVTSIQALKQALDDAGVDPSTYDRAHPPAGLTADQKARIDAAASDLGGGTTLRALQDLDQQARDVCKTPLTL